MFSILCSSQIEYHPSDVEIATLVEYLPLNFFSKLWGTVHSVKLPMWARVPLYRFWSVTFGCNLDEIRYPLESYANLAEFFSRPLREGARNISNSMLVWISLFFIQLFLIFFLCNERLPFIDMRCVISIPSPLLGFSMRLPSRQLWGDGGQHPSSSERSQIFSRSLPWSFQRFRVSDSERKSL